MGCPPPQQQQQPPPLNPAGSPSNNMPPGNAPVSLFNLLYLDKHNATHPVVWLDNLCDAQEMKLYFFVLIHWFLAVVNEYLIC
jgi:hypothetical protein